MNRLWIAAALIAGLCTSQVAMAQDLTLGSKAPKLQVKKFIKGDEVKGFEKGKIYVVEFWATWCGPCRTTIPHLTKLQKQYKDVTIIGVSILEKDQDDVTDFVDDMGDKMDYRVALDSVPEDGDGTDGAMVKGWMEPSEQRGIPFAFIINGDGLVAWIGHPAEMDEPLDKIVSGKWNLEAEVKKIKIIAKLQKEFAQFNESGDYSKLLKELDLAAKELPDRATQFTVLKFQVLVSPKGNADQALAVGNQLLESDDVGEDAAELNNLAWMLVSPDRESKPDVKLLKFALKVSLKADNLMKNQDASIADTLAKAYFDNGQLDKAVVTQERVIELMPGTDLENDPSVKKRLRQYKRALEASKTDAAPKK